MTVPSADYALGSHVAPWVSTSRSGRPPGSRGAFIGEHGSWNRRPRSGHEVIFVPFEGGGPAGRPQTVLTAFSTATSRAAGRPAGVILDASGGLLVADDLGNRVWRVHIPGRD